MSDGRWQVTGDRLYVAGENPLDNPFYGYRTTDLKLPDGRPAIYHGLLVGDVVHALPLEDDLTAHLIRQPRPNARAVDDPDVPDVLELPGGSADPGRSLAASADREMCQEIGLRSRRMELVGVLWTAVGVSDERDSIFLATSLYPARDHHHDEATEQSIVVVSRPFGYFYDRLRTGRVRASAQTVAALTLVAARL